MDTISPSLEEQLFDAIYGNDLKKVEELLTQGVEINAYVRCGRTLLGAAVQLGNLPCIRMLLEAHDYWKRHSCDSDKTVVQRRKCDVNLLDYYERSALHHAAELGRMDILDVLLEAGCRVNMADSENVAPLHLAAKRGHKDIVERLLRAGCQINYMTSEKASALHIAASWGFPDVVECLVEHGTKIDALDVSDRTPLWLAVTRGHHDVVEKLIAHGAKVNIAEVRGYTPLAEAVFRKDETMVRILLEAGARVTKSDYLLHNCVRHRNYRLVELLLDFGCLINLRDDHGDTPLHIAARTGEVKILDLLLTHGANVNYPNMISGSSPLHEAVQGIRDSDHAVFVNLLKHLIRSHCNLNAESYTRGDFPLYRAICLEKFNLAAALIRYGCDVNKGYVDLVSCVIDNLCLAHRKNNMKIAKLLVYGGFDLSRTSCWLEALPPSCSWESHFQEGPCNCSDDVKTWLTHIKRAPLNLMHLCRIVVRKRAGHNVQAKIVQMMLPQRLTRYLMLEDEE